MKRLPESVVAVGWIPPAPNGVLHRVVKRRMNSRFRRLIVALTALIGGGTGSVRAQSNPVATSPGLFEYHSSFWVNLHHRLYQNARARNGLDTNRAIVRAALADTAGLGRLSSDQGRHWDSALTYYRLHLASHDLLDRPLAAVKAALGDCENAQTLEGAEIDDSLRIVLEAAAPAYRVAWWPRDDGRNRSWIAAIRPWIDRYGTAMARETSRVFHIEWSDFLIRVDVAAYANWSGAYTTVYPDRITIAASELGETGASAVETLLHESLHTLDDSVRASLAVAATRHNKKVPADLIHAMIFYTAGEVARRELPDHYVPYAEREGIWQRGAFPTYLPLLRAHWLPWIEHRATYADAVDAIVAGLP